MKKLVAVSIILALFSSVAFTQEIGLGTYNQAVFVPLRIYDDDDRSGTDNAWSTIGPHWMGPGANPIRTSVIFVGQTDYAGFEIDLGYDYGRPQGFTDVDNAKLWIKPFNMLKLTYGLYVEDELRGKIGDFSDFASFGAVGGTVINDKGGAVGGAVRNQDTIFTRFQSSANGFHIALTPIEGLYIGADVDVEVPKGGVTNKPHGDDVWGDSLQVGIGYTIANIGLVRAQYVPRNEKSYSALNDGIIEAAFAFTGVEGLTIDAGVKVPLYFGDTLYAGELYEGIGVSTTEKDKGRDGRELFQFAVGADFASGDFGIQALVNARFYSEVDKNLTAGYSGVYEYLETPDFYLYLRPSYNLGSFIVGVDIGFDNKASFNQSTSTGKVKAAGAMDLGAWIAKPVAGGTFRIGVMLGLPFGDYVTAGNASKKPNSVKDGQIMFSVPITAEVTL